MRLMDVELPHVEEYKRESQPRQEARSCEAIRRREEYDRRQEARLREETRRCEDVWLPVADAIRQTITANEQKLGDTLPYWVREVLRNLPSRGDRG
jgi:hypothetical protein